jgi:hypothetical protein
MSRRQLAARNEAMSNAASQAQSPRAPSERAHSQTLEDVLPAIGLGPFQNMVVVPARGAAPSQQPQQSSTATGAAGDILHVILFVLVRTRTMDVLFLQHISPSVFNQVIKDN